MNRKNDHITEIFQQFARVQQERLKRRCGPEDIYENGELDQLLAKYKRKSEASIVQHALVDPYFPLGVLERTVFADVVGMRFYVNKLRSDMEPMLVDELLNWSTTFLQIRQDIRNLFDPHRITCIPLDGQRHGLPNDQWCTLCGVCCQIGGVPPEPPASIHYPEHWHRYLAGKALDNQQLCPFLFQYFGEAVFFCAIHHIKPLACRQFDEQDCRRRLSERALHLHQSGHS
jgi:hypothetical protein